MIYFDNAATSFYKPKEVKFAVIDAMKNNLHERFHDLNLKAIENGYQSMKG